MKSLRLIALSIALLGFNAACFANELEPKLNYEELYARSDLWPFYVKWTSDSKGPGGGFSGVLTRMENAETALIDFGRDGMYTVSVCETNILEQASAVQSGKLEKDTPNFIRQTTNMFLRRIPDGPISPYKSEDMAAFERILVLYADSDLLTDENWEVFSAATTRLEEADVLTVIIPKNIDFSQALPDTSWGEVNVMLAYSAPAMIKALDHEPLMAEGAVTFVLVDVEGKLLWRDVINVQDANLVMDAAVSACE